VTTPINRRDIPYILFIAASFLFGLAFSWQRWGNPLVDCGREMNQPLRLVEGQMLYSDVRHIYGPLSPYINAFLYWLFTPSLNTLYASGMVTAIIIIGVCYWLSRQLMSRQAALASTLAVMWLCGFKQAGNYILPYSYGALHACALGLITLYFLVKAVGNRQSAPGNPKEIEQHDSGEASLSAHNKEIELETKPDNHQLPTAYLILAGVFASFTLLAKTEMGIATLTTGIIAGALVVYPNLNRAWLAIGVFLLPALTITCLVYGLIIYRVGWHTLSHESYLVFQNLPPELVYFNKRMSGLDRPWESVVAIVGSLLRLALVAVAIAVISQLLTRKKDQQQATNSIPIADAGQIKIVQLWVLLLISVILILSLSLTGIIQWDNGPYLAMPILLIGLLFPGLRQYLKELGTKGVANQHLLLVIVIAVYALASLARVIMRVRSGGAYSSYLLPASVVLFTYILAYQLPRLIRHQRARILARNIAIALILLDAILTSFLLAYRYRSKNTYPISTQRGTILAVPDLGKSFEEAIDYIGRETREGDYVAVMPEGTSLNFLTNRANPLREEITTPGFIDAPGEERTIKRLQETNTKLILIANRATSEFGPIRFGRDYNQRLMEWIKENYEEHEIFGPDHNPNLQIGDPIFFLRAYRKKTAVLQQR
jgi:hypothetical protein